MWPKSSLAILQETLLFGPTSRLFLFLPLYIKSNLGKPISGAEECKYFRSPNVSSNVVYCSRTLYRGQMDCVSVILHSTLGVVSYFVQTLTHAQHSHSCLQIWRLIFCHKYIDCLEARLECQFCITCEPRTGGQNSLSGQAIQNI